MRQAPTELNCMVWRLCACSHQQSSTSSKSALIGGFGSGPSASAMCVINVLCVPNLCCVCARQICAMFVPRLCCVCQMCAVFVPTLCCVCDQRAMFAPNLCHVCANFVLCVCQICAMFVPNVCCVCAKFVPCLCKAGADRTVQSSRMVQAHGLGASPGLLSKLTHINKLAQIPQQGGRKADEHTPARQMGTASKAGKHAQSASTARMLRNG